MICSIENYMQGEAYVIFNLIGGTQLCVCISVVWSAQSTQIQTKNVHESKLVTILICYKMLGNITPQSQTENILSYSIMQNKRSVTYGVNNWGLLNLLKEIKSHEHK